MSKEGKTYTKAEAAAYLKKCKNTISNYIRDGILTAYSLPSGRGIIIYEDDLNKLLVKVKNKKDKEILHG